MTLLPPLPPPPVGKNLTKVINYDAPTLYLIDGSGFIFRAFHALPPLTSPNNIPVGAVYGFCNILIRFLGKLTQNSTQDCLAVIFDADRQTFRQQIYRDYKANRADTPADLIPQFSLIREACQVMGIPAIDALGYEADDLIASYAKFASNQGYNVVIVSSDKDLMQLVDDKVTLLDPIKNKKIGINEVVEKFGVMPTQVIEVQALMGDRSDNVPGVPGIGPKTAAELIQQFGTLEQLLEHKHTIKQNKRRQSLEQYAEQAKISKKLVTLEEKVPLPLNLDQLRLQNPDWQKCQVFFQKHGFKNLITKFKGPVATNSATSTPEFECITSVVDLNKWQQLINGAGLFAIDTETTGLNIQRADLVGISLAVPIGEGEFKSGYIPLFHQTLEPQLQLAEVREVLGPLLRDSAILKIGHNLKYDMGILNKYDLPIVTFDDTMLMSYSLDGGKNGHGLDELASLHFNYQTISFEDVAGSGKGQKTFDLVEIPRATVYAAEDAYITLKLYFLFKQRLRVEGKNQLYEYIERPLVPVIVKMEAAGILVDKNLLTELGRNFTERLHYLEQEIYEIAKRPFNVASPKQLGEILFDELSLSGGKKTKTGAYVTDAETLENLAIQGHELPAKVLSWRGLAKLRSTYTEGLIAAINPTSQRIHTSFSLATTVTGRLSSSDPNLQNIPIRTPDGRKIRKVFIATNGYKIVSLDYSQIELRLLAHIAKVDSLINAFNNNEDVHSITAAQIFNIAVEDVNLDQRRQAKTINFGIIYGISPFGLGQQLGIPSGHAAKIIHNYFAKYPGIKDYMEFAKNQAAAKGYVETLFGRRCYIKGINDKNAVVRAAAERQAINAPIQGSNADIIKKTMISIDQLLLASPFKAKMLLQVHDELLFEIPEAEVDLVVPDLKRVMESVISLTIPLKVDCGVGNNWQDSHG